MYRHSPRPPHSAIFFFFMLPPPPRSTLFPYTTLFRSDPNREQQTEAGRGQNSAARAATATSDQLLSAHNSHDARIAEGMPRDRKSTRLNSSHPSISYAVFCLKKKKKKKIHTDQHPPTH